MSIYSLSVSNVSRAKMQSSTASYAYISGEEVKDERTGMVKQYSRDDKILAKGNILPDDAPQRYKDNAADWVNDIELYEQADNARPCKKYVMALPKELNLEQQRATVEQWIKNNCTEHGYAATYAIHQSKDGQNPHVHILVANRPLKNGKWQQTKYKTVYKLDQNGKKIPMLDEHGNQKVRVRPGKGVEKLWEREKLEENYLDQKSTLKSMRESWARVCNEYLPEDMQIDHRSYADQGKLQIPTRHEGHAARQLEARAKAAGLDIKADVCEYNRQVKQRNKEIQEELVKLDAQEATRQQAIASVISDVSSRITPNLRGKEATEVEGTMWDIKNLMYESHAKELEAEAAKVLGVDQERAEVKQAIAEIKNTIDTTKREHQRDRSPLVAEEKEARKGVEKAQKELKKLEQAEEERMNGGFLKMLLSKKDKAGLAKAGKALQQAEKRHATAKTALATLDGQHQARLQPLQAKASKLEARANGIHQAIMGKVDEIGGKQVYGYKQIEAAISKFDNRHALPGPAGKAVGIAKGIAGAIKSAPGQLLDVLGGPDGEGGFDKAVSQTMEGVVKSMVQLDPAGAGMSVAKMPMAVLKNVESDDVRRDKMREAMEQAQAEEGLLLGGKGKSKPKGKDKEASQDKGGHGARVYTPTK